MDYNSLTTKGYLIIKSFLNADEIKLLTDDFTQGGVPGSGVLYGRMSNNCFLAIGGKILNAIEQIKTQHVLDVDFIMPVRNPWIADPRPAGEYISTERVVYRWHQDYETYYVLQQNYNSLNFYIPIIKPNPALSGLSIIPFDSLEQSVPEYIDKIKNQGATTYIPTDNITEVWNGNEGYHYTLPFNIDSIAISPVLVPGDLLLLRGDVIHRTQDNQTIRTSVSIRATSGRSVINKDKIFSGGKLKKIKLADNADYYAWLKTRFDLLGKDEVTPLELFN